ncbi:formyltetrahydrofolate deformylase [Acidipropionibacterium jensenii]|uniref:Formyltetrahydrofolate deformylase n=1 Tax=Acidipropionibacterium jensenii TaxID=1749 RepID=A0A3Q9UM84_9ACTN|nr:formyltetrahydrofolate deformylase [Acidipropionibacterium jensenii]AZZ40676.1 formyltetrahydrofolate deformylase [Acidipropionibacterium jensenii]MDN5976770.1 formyltetrahydrofolate deformylase [Acidipropionibacterium jensenii]MDN5995650.1 formyltetrahydrofolate deformylase [Acidipropionibacterium jensenii]MDN6425837.1 formyltetrahydrofolate deformylase [Acidipropionibacterium jensenii]MDN6442733.1 formyltetrahydrofolate deformylase [Acidipropionibacterium jensenii]
MTNPLPLTRRSDDELVVTWQCPDRPGIVHAVTGACVSAGGNLTELQQFSSTDTGRFFMRLQVRDMTSAEDLTAALRGIAPAFDATVSVDHLGRPLRTLVLASKAPHCLSHLLFNRQAGRLPLDVVAVMANHPDLADLAAFYGVDFEHRQITRETKAEFEKEVLDTVRDRRVELVVLARYMQILSPELCEALAGRCINIHHSFLPGFKGASPYRQAHERGVKLIGATAHFVTDNLDEGPIIEQNVQRVDHSQTVAQLTAIGQDTESTTLAEAVRLFCEHRTFVDGRRTVIFR